MCPLKGSCKPIYPDRLMIKQNAVVTSQYLMFPVSLLKDAQKHARVTCSLCPCREVPKEAKKHAHVTRIGFASRNLIIPCLNFILHKKK